MAGLGGMAGTSKRGRVTEMSFGVREMEKPFGVREMEKPK